VFVQRPIKSDKSPKLDSTSNLATSLGYLDKLYNQKLSKLNENSSSTVNNYIFAVSKIPQVSNFYLSKLIF
jgi:hypothetical protein